MISKLRQLNFGDWIYGLLNAFVGGGAGAVTSAFTASVIAPGVFNLGAGLHNTLQLIGATFAINGLLSAFFYLKQSPLPAIVETTSTTKTSTTVVSTEKQ